MLMAKLKSITVGGELVGAGRTGKGVCEHATARVVGTRSHLLDNGQHRDVPLHACPVPPYLTVEDSYP
jgi:hypothetical protein